MSHLRWTTKPTKDYLDSLKEEYLRIKGNGTLVTTFMRSVRNWYFTRYKCQADEVQEREDGEKYKIYPDDQAWRNARLAGIKFWFLNNTKSTAQPVKITLGTEAGGSSSRKLTNEQVYSKLYYPERVKEDAEAEIERVGANKGQKLAIRNRHIREKLENETDEVKQEVEQKRREMEQEKVELAETLKLLKDPTRGRLAFEELARVQRHIPKILGLFFDDLYAKTGWCFNVRGGGPQVEIVNAPIKYTSYSVGYIDDTTTFEAWSKQEGTWKDDWKQFATFAHKAFPEDVRLQMAIDIDEKLVDNKDLLASSGRLTGKLCFVEEPDGMKAGAQESPKEPVGGKGAERHGETTETHGGKTPDGGEEKMAEEDSIENNKSKKSGTNRCKSSTKGRKRNSKADKQGLEGTVAVAPPSEEQESHKEDLSAPPDNQLDVCNTGGESGGATELPNPFDIPPILQQWAQEPFASPHTPMRAEWGLNQHQPNALSGKLFDGGMGNTGSTPYEAMPSFTGFGGTGSTAYLGENCAFGQDFNIDTSSMNLDAEYGMSVKMFELAGNNILGDLPNVPLGNPTPLPNLNIVHPDFQMGLRMGVSGDCIGRVGTENPFPAMNGFLAGAGGVGSFDSGFRGIDAQGRAGAAPPGVYNEGMDESGERAGVNNSGLGLSYGPPACLTNGELGASTSAHLDGGNSANLGGGRKKGKGGKHLVETDEAKGGGNGDDDDDGELDGGAKGNGNGKKRLISMDEPTEERSKRSRTAKKHPEWVEDARRYLLDGLKDPHWVELVDQWFQWEIQCSGLGGAVNGTLPGAAARPPIVKKWLADGCRWDAQDTVSSDQATAFQAKWIKWWNAMQPKIRRAADDGMPHRVDDTMARAMGTLKKAGENGVILLLRALKMWAPREEGDGKWQQAVQDVADCVRVLGLRG